MNIAPNVEAYIRRLARFAPVNPRERNRARTRFVDRGVMSGFGLPGSLPD